MAQGMCCFAPAMWRTGSRISRRTFPSGCCSTGRRSSSARARASRSVSLTGMIVSLRGRCKSTCVFRGRPEAPRGRVRETLKSAIVAGSPSRECILSRAGRFSRAAEHRISLLSTSMRRKIAPNGPGGFGTRGESRKCRLRWRKHEQEQGASRISSARTVEAAAIVRDREYVSARILRMT